MNDVILKQPQMLGWLILLVPAAVLIVYRSRRQTEDLHNFIPSQPGTRHMPVRRKIRTLLTVLGLFFLIISLSRPAVNPHPEQLYKEGRDLTFMLDVSNSMLAEDLAPNRLERAKIYIQDCVKSLKNHRIALVVFAGSASIKCPLTTDKEFFLETLQNCGPASVSQGGTRFSDAILKTCDKIFGKATQSQNIILISDGGNQSAQLNNEIELINKKQIRLFCIGVGDAVSGARIPNPAKTNEFLKKDKQEIWTKLETAKLKELVKSCKGAVYIPAGVKSLKLDEAYHDLQSMSRPLQRSDHENIVYDDIFHITIFIGLLCLAASLCIPEKYGLPKVVAGVLLIVFNCSFDNAGVAEMIEKARKNPTTENYFQLANHCFKASNYSFAVDFYTEALKLTKDKTKRITVSYNLAVALSQLAQAEEALETLEERLDVFDQSLKLYRILTEECNTKKFRENLAFTINARRKVIRQIRKLAADEKAFKEAKRLIKAQLEKALAFQIEALKKVDVKGNKQQVETNHTTKAAEALLLRYTKILKGFDKGVGLLTFVKMFVDNALAAQKELTVTEVLEPRRKLAERSKGEIKNALSALTSDQQAKSQDNDSDNSSDEEGDAEESDEESDNMEMDDTENSTLDESMSMQNIKPKDSVEDLLKREKELQKSRSQNSKKDGGRSSKEGVTW